MKKSIGVGTKAPDMERSDARGLHVQLSEALKLGPVVLVFYPGDFTPGCTVQLCAIRDDWKAFRDLGISVYGVNHADADSHKKFAEAHRLPFPLLVDTNKSVSKAFGAIRKIAGATLIRRTVVGIPPDGIIRFYKHGFPKHADILKTLKPFVKEA